MAKSARKATPSTIVNRTVPRRAPNSELRPREYLTEKEIERLQDTARKRSRYGHRDATMILVTYRHGLARLRSVWPAVGSDRTGLRPAACPPGQGRHR